ncbi:methionyl aminopeptidase [Duganella sp. CF402]|uniref:type I methionyl aminopeptidase n=1 Tax=unclassified Duganella TaxID=2636909 RepID=UPI0008C82E93|nr:MULTISPECIES: type I methionyl aminopeptidase [unclassified Duganella]RZT08094.1 methionine aminopeptidase type I [Duganella sp. BK701]SEM05855.1 methionyl aminopeptidase [Duganella sp. CF402]
MSRRNANLIKTPEQMVQARVAAQLAADVLTMIAPHVKAGVTTAYLDQLCNDYIVNVQQAIPANVGYGGFPATVCSSVNHVVCHGIPSADQVLKNGDIINIDVAVIKDGWHGDTSRMYYVGEPSKPTRKLVETTYAAMWAGIRAVKPKATLGDVGFAIQTVAEKAGYSVVLDYCGHGIGMVYHEDPQVTHYGRPGQGLVLKPGMLFTIEPMINAGKAATKELSDGWTVETRDKSLSAQWEHMVHVTETGFEVLTLAPGETGSKANIPNAVPAGAEVSAG